MNTFESIIGYEEIKYELRIIADVLKNTDKYKAFGVCAPRGLLLSGEPGVGKTLMANALIYESGRKMFVCRKNMPDTDFTNHINKIFTEAKQNAPSIVFLDDIDKYANNDKDHKDASIFVTIQAMMDEIGDSEVFVIATANEPEKLPDSLKREGRFEKTIEVYAAFGDEGKRVTAHYLKKTKSTDIKDMESISKILEGKSCAAIQTLVNRAGIIAAYESAESITDEHLIKAILSGYYKVPEYLIGKKRQNLENTTEKMRRIIYHEAAHATVSEVLSPGSVSLIAAYMNKNETVAFVSSNANDDIPRIDNMYISIVTALAGKAALRLKFGCNDTGANKDLKGAFTTEKALIRCECVGGFNLRQGTISDVSEQSKAALEQVGSFEAERLSMKATEILVKNVIFFEKIANELALKGYLVTRDIDEIKSTCTITPVSI